MRKIKQDQEQQLPDSPGTSKADKTRKRRRIDASDNGNIEQDLDRNERASSSNSNIAQTGVMPKDMYKFCKYLLELQDSNQLHLATKKGNVKFNVLLQGIKDLDPTLDIASFQNYFITYYRWASNISEVPLLDALQRVMSYVQSKDVLQKRPDFPKRPANPYTFFMQNQGLNPFTAGSSDKFRNKKDKNVIEAEEECKSARVNYINQLREFLDAHNDDLFQVQIEYISKELTRMEKAVSDESRRPKPRARPKVQKDLVTAFELYKKTKADKYNDLDSDEKEKKLLRRFNKLSEDQREIYESIAAKLREESEE